MSSYHIGKGVDWNDLPQIEKAGHRVTHLCLSIRLVSTIITQLGKVRAMAHTN